jgi:hypothetical protein
MSKVMATTSGKGHCQAKSGTMTKAEPKPVRPSTV